MEHPRFRCTCTMTIKFYSILFFSMSFSFISFTTGLNSCYSVPSKSQFWLNLNIGLQNFYLSSSTKFYFSIVLCKSTFSSSASYFSLISLLLFHYLDTYSEPVYSSTCLGLLSCCTMRSDWDWLLHYLIILCVSRKHDHKYSYISSLRLICSALLSQVMSLEVKNWHTWAFIFFISLSVNLDICLH